MVSVFDQYDQATAFTTGYASQRPSVPEMTAAGFINASLEEDVPIFSKQKTEFRPQEPISHLVASNGQIIVAMKSKVLWIDSSRTEEFDLTRTLGEKAWRSKVYNMFLDLNGRHLLISLINMDNQGPQDNLYVSRGSRKVQHANKMKGHIISAVAWNFYNSNENTTGYILMGTTKGLIFETELASSDERHFFQTGPEQSWKQVFDIGEGNEGIITGLEFRKMSGTDNRYFILATTPKRLYQFVGSVPVGTEQSVLQHIFNNYKDILERFEEIPSSLNYSKLLFYSSPPKECPKTFAWMIEPGIYYGMIDCTGQAGEDSVTAYTSLLNYPEDKGGGKKKPLSMVLTEFHSLVMFPYRMKVICVLNEQLVFEDVFTEMDGPMIGITKDPVKETIWAFSEMTLYRYDVVNEDRDVWEVYLNKGEYQLAEMHCKKDPVKLDRVLTTQAQDCFNKKYYEESARLYAKTHSSFEEIALKFFQAEQEEALKEFLLKKLEGLKFQDKTQITMIVFWLLEIFLNQMGLLRNASKQTTDEYKKLQSSFQKLLEQSRVKECVTANRSAVYGLITSHGDEENLIFFTKLMKDYERVIQYHLQNKNYTAALDVLTKQSRAELFYQFSPALMQVIPHKTVDAWLSQNHRLSPAKLIPALVQYDHTRDPEHGSEAIRYLEFCVNQLGNREQAIHNYLLALYARLKPDMLMNYLHHQGQDEASVPYDLKYALRLCSELDLKRACVHIYATMGLFEEAVELALQVDVGLAKINANAPEDSDELKKILWLKIAEHVVKKENDIKKAMEFLHECQLIKIEDILPFFPEFVTIDHFKDAICSSLNEYNQHIESLKQEMEDATESAQEIRAEIIKFRKNYTVVLAKQKCSACDYPLMTGSFYVFPCSHKFHSDCLIKEVQRHLTPSKKNRIDELQRQLASMSGRDDTTSLSSVSVASATTSTREKLTAELDDLVASECLYCGDIMIRSIDEPFIDPEEYKIVVKSWE